MIRVTVDTGDLAKLTGPAELVDGSGKTIGYFLVPEEFEAVRKTLEQRRRDYEWARGVFTDEVLHAADVSGGEYTYEEVRDHLRRLERTEQARSA